MNRARPVLDLMSRRDSPGGFAGAWWLGDVGLVRGKAGDREPNRGRDSPLTRWVMRRIEAINRVGGDANRAEEQEGCAGWIKRVDRASDFEFDGLKNQIEL